MHARPDLSHLAMIPLPEVTPVVRESVLDASDELDNLTTLALKKLREVLEIPTDPDNIKLLGRHISAAQTVLNTQVRVDESRLKRRQNDTIGKLLDAMRDEERRQAKLIEGTIAA